MFNQFGGGGMGGFGGGQPPQPPSFGGMPPQAGGMGPSAPPMGGQVPQTGGGFQAPPSPPQMPPGGMFASGGMNNPFNAQQMAGGMRGGIRDLQGQLDRAMISGADPYTLMDLQRQLQYAQEDMGRMGADQMAQYARQNQGVGGIGSQAGSNRLDPYMMQMMRNNWGMGSPGGSQMANSPMTGLGSF